MRIIEVNSDYIDYLHKFDRFISLDHKDGKTRKYLGIVFTKEQRQYCIPLSSPDESDYQNGKLRKSFFPCIFRISRYNAKNNKRIFLGKLLFNNMIPVCESVINEYDITKETDVKYKNLLNNQIRLLRKPFYDGTLQKYANKIYLEKLLNIDKGYIKNTVDFLLLEQKCDEWERLQSMQQNQKKLKTPVKKTAKLKL
ncbi:type III toxin-antitoxin system ToxN/AbiQ family toxin [Thomasclavelia cocleata]|uniref:type III toxin-antitoxin system ToxN/AbiQ family toxin n=2 Tax=Thomasclavelia cocleata TaxID=69824 RepID=UPI002495A78C|nr:type III toxin-antitoxin system ToxN/AbiQ family toxin [Thomasclavelia cocleata]